MTFFVHSMHYNPYPKPISRLLGDLIEGISSSKTGVIVFTARFGQKATPVASEKIVRIPNLGRLSEYFPLKLLDYFSFYTFSFLASLWFRIFYRSPASIYRSGFGISTFFAFLTVKLFKGQVYFWVLDRYPDILFENRLIKNGKLFKILKKTEIVFQRNFSGIIFETKSDQKDYLFNKGGLNSTQISTWSEEIKGMPLKEPDFWVEKALNFRKVFLFSGNISTSVDLDAMIDFFAMRPESTLLILGEGSEKARLVSIIQARCLDNILVYKFQEDAVYRFLLKNSEFGIVSLKQDVSIFSSKLTSYISAGLPILALISKNNEMADLILNNKCGYVLSKGISSHQNIRLEKNNALIINSESLAQEFSRDFAVLKFLQFLGISEH